MSDSFLRLADVQRRVPFSRSAIYLMISRGEFPKQISLGARAVGWLKSEIDQWVESASQSAIRLDFEAERPSRFYRETSIYLIYKVNH